MTDRDLTAVLERAVDALSPRDPDPVGAVLRRVRARRRRVVTVGAAAVLAVGGVGAAGALAVLGGDGSTGTVPAGPVRHVEPWSGETVTLEGVHVPVPAGWRVEHPAANPPGPCRAKGADRTVYVVDPDHEWWPCEVSKATYVIVEVTEHAYPVSAVDSYALLDPSGQPVFVSSAPASVRVQDRQANLQFVFSQVAVVAFGFEPADADELLAGVTADDAAPGGRIRLPAVVRAAHTVDFDQAHGSGSFAFESTDPDLRALVEPMLSEPAAALTCLPATGDLALTTLDGGTQPGSDSSGFINVFYDRTGACDLAFGQGGQLVRVDGAALHRLLRERTTSTSRDTDR